MSFFVSIFYFFFARIRYNVTLRKRNGPVGTKHPGVNLSTYLRPYVHTHLPTTLRTYQRTGERTGSG